MDIKKLKLAIFISGRGSNMRAIHEACQNPDYPAEIVAVFSNNPDAGGLSYAQENNIPIFSINHKDYPSRETFEEDVQKQLAQYDIDLIVLAGFMRILSPSFIENWEGRIINIHPSLLPDYKGTHTHERVIQDGKTESGCTVHYVNAELDSGSIILQKKVPVLPDDTPETLAERILEQEHIIYPKAIAKIALTHQK